MLGVKSFIKIWFYGIKQALKTFGRKKINKKWICY